MHDFGVAPGSKDKFVESFSESAIAAGLAERTDDGQLVLVLLDEDGAAGKDVAPSTTTVLAADPDPALIKPQSPSRQPAPPVVHQRWEIDEGTITFEIATAKPLPASAFVTVGDVVASLERLATTLAPAPTDIAGDGPEG